MMLVDSVDGLISSGKLAGLIASRLPVAMLVYSLFLKELMEGALTTFAGSLFQVLMTQLLKVFARKFSLDLLDCHE